MTSLLKSKLPFTSSSNNEIDYEELETRFQIHKYYPKCFHNYDYSTPVIKDLIADKPIYLKANAHVKTRKFCPKKQPQKDLRNLRKTISGELKNESKGMKKELKDNYHEQKQTLDKGDKRDARYCYIQQKKALRNDIRQDIKQLDKEYRDSKRLIRASDRKMDKESPPSYENDPLASIFNNVYTRDIKHNRKTSDSTVKNINILVTVKKSDSKEEPPRFNDPFTNDSTLIPLVASQLHAMSKSNSMVKPGLNSVASKFKKFIKNSPPKELERTNLLQPSRSFDQTKLQMTTSRAKKSLFLKFTGNDIGRRNSEQQGTYNNFRRLLLSLEICVYLMMKGAK